MENMFFWRVESEHRQMERELEVFAVIFFSYLCTSYSSKWHFIYAAIRNKSALAPLYRSGFTSHIFVSPFLVLVSGGDIFMLFHWGTYGISYITANNQAYIINRFYPFHVLPSDHLLPVMATIYQQYLGRPISVVYPHAPPPLQRDRYYVQVVKRIWTASLFHM